MKGNIPNMPLLLPGLGAESSGVTGVRSEGTGQQFWGEETEVVVGVWAWEGLCETLLIGTKELFSILPLSLYLTPSGPS